MSGKSTAKKVGDTVNVAKDAEWVVHPDGTTASVRTGATYTFNGPGTYVIGKLRAAGEGVTGTTYDVTEKKS